MGTQGSVSSLTAPGTAGLQLWTKDAGVLGVWLFGGCRCVSHRTGFQERGLWSSHSRWLRTCVHRTLELFSPTSLPRASCCFSPVTTYRRTLGSGRRTAFFYIFLMFIYLFIWLHRGLSCYTWDLCCCMWDQFPDQGLSPGPLHWEHGVLAAGPPGKSQTPAFLAQLLASDSVLFAPLSGSALDMAPWQELRSL